MPRLSYYSASKERSEEENGEQHAYSDRGTRKAWEAFVTASHHSETGFEGVRSQIVDSWKRSIAVGVDASVRRSPNVFDEDELEQRRERNSSLRQAATAAFKRLEPHLNDSRTILMLADEEGIVLDAIGDASVLDNGREIHLEIGGDWSEHTVGTNGIGTALKTGEPTYVHAAEHFAEGVQAWTCAGVPIRDPLSQSVLGVVDLSGPPQIFRKHNIALVLAAAREIEIALGEQQRLQRAKLLEAFFTSEKSKLDNSVLLLDQNGRVMFHRGAEASQYSSGALAIGHQLIPKLDAVSGENIGKYLPKDISVDGFEKLVFDGVDHGAALILAADKTPKPKIGGSRRIPPRKNVKENQIHIVGSSPKMLEAIELVERAANANVSILIQGETGVGKELFARLLHNCINRDNAPYVPLNCAAISSDLIGAELFGYVDGAFTGAARGGRKGKFELADGGVLCLDEIGDMPIELQPYLLRALEQRAVYRMGDNTRRPVDVRLVAMTNRNLRKEIDDGKFRRDLFYRIGAVTVHIPPLRQRGDDLFALIDHFSDFFAKDTNRERIEFSPEALQRLADYQWPGNVRELRNVVQSVYLLCSNQIAELSDLPYEFQEEPETETDDTLGSILEGNSGDLETIEANAIRKTLHAEAGNLTKVASVLGISRPTLYRKMKQYKIQR